MYNNKKNFKTTPVLCRRGENCYHYKRGNCKFYHPQKQVEKKEIKPEFVFNPDDFPALSLKNNKI
jgi:hypothetical protein